MDNLRTSFGRKIQGLLKLQIACTGSAKRIGKYIALITNIEDSHFLLEIDKCIFITL